MTAKDGEMCLFIQVVNNLIKDFIKRLIKVEKLPRRDEGVNGW